MELTVEKRLVQKKNVKHLISEGIIPAVVYGKHIKESYSIQFSKRDFLKLYKQHGTTSAIDLKGKGIKELVLIHDMYIEPVKDTLRHVDFLAIKADEVVHAEVPLVILGEEHATKNGIGLNIIRDHLAIEALPSDIPHEIKVDVSTLEDGENVMIKDIEISEGVKILENLDEAIVVAYDLSKAEQAEEIKEEAAAESMLPEEGEEGEEKKEESKD